MNSAALIRKEILFLLDTIFLPDIRSNKALCLMMAKLPLAPPPMVGVRELPLPPLSEADSTNFYPHGRRWDAVNMHALRIPFLECVAQGEADLRFGVTTTMLEQARGHKGTCGGYLLSLPSPSYLLNPAGVPVNNGAVLPWDRPVPHQSLLRLLKIRFLPVGALCHITTLQGTQYTVQYSLLVEDTALALIIEVLMNEMCLPKPNPEITAAQMLALFLRLRAGLSTRVPSLTDGLYSLFPEGDDTSGLISLEHNPALKKACNFIQAHLHEALTPATIAQQTRLTPTHLNRIFREELGLSTMRYVAQTRIQTAKLLLQNSDLSVAEIGHLVGYKHTSHFSINFHRSTGMSPLSFRQQHAIESQTTPKIAGAQLPHTHVKRAPEPKGLRESQPKTP